MDFELSFGRGNLEIAVNFKLGLHGFELSAKVSMVKVSLKVEW